MDSEYLIANTNNWNDKVDLHYKDGYNSEGVPYFYDVNSFKQGKCSLKNLELDEVGDVSGKSLLHLQCHFGMDTLSWARRGAIVTGVDFSYKAIDVAKELSQQLGINAEFIVSDIYKLNQVLTQEFDIVITNYGVICWLQNLPAWAAVISSFLKEGGIFYLADGHPVASIFEFNFDTRTLYFAYPYQQDTSTPSCDESGYTYGSDRQVTQHTKNYQWNHSLDSILNSLIAESLEIEFLHEYPWCFWKRYDHLEKDENDRYWFPNKQWTIPLTFSVKARRKRSNK